MKFVALVSLIFLCSCKESIEYPEGGYDYPKNITDEDTNFYAYPIKSLLKKGESFGHSYDYLIYRPFSEPNLSLKYLGTDIFRLTYGTTFGQMVIVVLKDGAITIKEGYPGMLYGHDTLRLTQTENHLFRILRRYYPIDTAGKGPRQKRYLDSMIKLFPQLLDSAFYHMLFEKEFFRTDEKFVYKEDKINTPKKQYDSIINEINLSGFWKFPCQIDCNTDNADGTGFTLEANTKNKFQIVSVSSCTKEQRKLNEICYKILEFSKTNKK